MPVHDIQYSLALRAMAAIVRYCESPDEMSEMICYAKAYIDAAINIHPKKDTPIMAGILHIAEVHANEVRHTCEQRLKCIDAPIV